MNSPNARAVLQHKKWKEWRVSSEIEQRKLSGSRNCLLAGSGSPVKTKTRQKKTNRSSVGNDDEDTSGSTTIDSISRPRNLFIGRSSASLISPLTDSISTSSSTGKKPKESRVILETRALTELMERHIRCPNCSSGVKVSYHSKMIATTIRMDCTDPTCGFVDVEKPTIASPPLPEGSSLNIKRNSDAAINILYVLSFLTDERTNGQLKRVRDSGQQAGPGVKFAHMLK